LEVHVEVTLIGPVDALVRARVESNICGNEEIVGAGSNDVPDDISIGPSCCSIGRLQGPVDANVVGLPEVLVQRRVHGAPCNLNPVGTVYGLHEIRTRTEFVIGIRSHLSPGLPVVFGDPHVIQEASVHPHPSHDHDGPIGQHDDPIQLPRGLGLTWQSWFDLLPNVAMICVEQVEVDRVAVDVDVVVG